MNGTYLYIILPESESTTLYTPWNLLNEEYWEYENFVEFVKELSSYLLQIKNENFFGKYDLLNILSFLKELEVLEDLYPNSPTRILRSILKNFEDWRKDLNNWVGDEYIIFGQGLKNHSLCKISNHLSSISENENIALLNHKALSFRDDITINFNRKSNCIPNINSIEKISTWFQKNRIPCRKFHDTDKHKENNNGNWDNASPLRCTLQQAQNLLNSAIGDKTTLYNIDIQNNCWIKFMYDNVEVPIGQKQYHGYSLDIDSVEIPDAIKKIILKR